MFGKEVMKPTLCKILVIVVWITLPLHVSISQTTSNVLNEVYTEEAEGIWTQVRFGSDEVSRLAASWIKGEEPFRSSWTIVYDVPSMNPVDSHLQRWPVGPTVMTRDDHFLVMSGFPKNVEEHTWQIQFWAYGKNSLVVPTYDSVGQPLQLGTGSLLYTLLTSFDDRYLYIPGGWGVRIADLTLDPPQIVDTLEHYQYYNDTLKGPMWSNDAALNSTGQQIVSVDVRGGIKMWKTERRELLWEKSFKDKAGLRLVEWSKDDTKLLVGVYGESFLAEDPGSIEIWNAMDASPIEKIALPPSQNPEQVYWAKDEQYIVARCFDTTLRIWDATTLKLLEEFRPHSSLFFMDVSPDGNYIVTAGHDSVMRVWEFTTSSVSTPVAGESALHLLSPRPNPSKDVVELSFMMDQGGETELVLVDLHGREMETITKDYYESGTHSLWFNIEELSVGTYYVVLKSDREHRVQAMQVLR